MGARLPYGTPPLRCFRWSLRRPPRTFRPVALREPRPRCIPLAASPASRLAKRRLAFLFLPGSVPVQDGAESPEEPAVIPAQARGRGDDFSFFHVLYGCLDLLLLGVRRGAWWRRGVRAAPIQAWHRLNRESLAPPTTQKSSLPAHTILSPGHVLLPGNAVSGYQLVPLNLQTVGTPRCSPRR